MKVKDLINAIMEKVHESPHAPEGVSVYVNDGTHITITSVSLDEDGDININVEV